jgi:hypothetical protein
MKVLDFRFKIFTLSNFGFLYLVNILYICLFCSLDFSDLLHAAS